MSSSKSVASLFTASLFAVAAFVSACATATDPASDGPTGQIALQLVQPGPHGEIYHLANATFDIVHVDDGSLTTVDGSTTDPGFTVSLAPGLVNISLRDGWTLEKSTDGGATFQPVSALLGSPNPNVVRVLANQLAFVEFGFLIRERNGTLGITLGIVTNPRQLAGGISVQTATDGLAGYAVVGPRSLDFAIYFNLIALESVILEDGTRQRIYTAFGQQGSFGPVPLPTGTLATEFYNDDIGTLAGPIATELTGGFLTYTVEARTDGTIQLSGQLLGGFTDIEFGPSPIDAVLPTLDADGFPNDEFFYNTAVPFTQTSAQGTMTGLLRMRQLPAAP
jgi:hypothetical protein